MQAPFEWLDPAEELPEDPEEIVLACISGRCEGTVFNHAFQFAFFEKDGWRLEVFPRAEFTVHWWTHIPDTTEEAKGDD